MKNGQLTSKGKLKPYNQNDRLLVADIVHYLTGLARLQAECKTGNIDLSNGLQELSNVLRPYSDYPLAELSNAIKEKSVPAIPTKAIARRVTPRKVKSALPSNLESLAHEDVEKILDNDDYTKQQISELGFKRFGISKPMLQRLRKEDARQSVRSALDNERTLDVISEMARKAGKARAS